MSMTHAGHRGSGISTDGQIALLDPGVERPDLLFGKRRHVGLRGRIVDQMLKPLTLAERRAERVDRRHDGVELGEFAGEPHIGFLIGA